jgi:hypothetical protein
MPDAGAGNGRRLLLAVVASAAVFAATAALGPVLAQGSVLPAGPSGSVEAEWLGDRPVWVVTTAAGKSLVLDAVNPHPWYGMQELVGWCPTQRMFSAYYDGSRFDSTGHYLFGPAPAGLTRYTVASAGDGRVRVGRAVPSTTRAGSDWQPTEGADYCFVESGIPRVPARDDPLADYHDAAGWDGEIVEGSVVLSADGGVFCGDLVSADPFECRDAPVRIAGALALQNEVGVHHGQFAVHRRGGQFTEVTALPGGYLAYIGSP